MPKDETVDLLEPTPEKRSIWKWVVALLALLLAGGAIYYLVNPGSGEPNPAVVVVNPSVSPAASPSPVSTATPGGGGVGTSAPSGTETVNFGFNSSEVLSGDAPKLRSFWSEIRGRATTVNIEGHADNIGSDDYNQQLSESRAKHVAASLRQLGMDRKFKVNVRGFGRSKPVTDNTTSEGRARNRRVEISYND